MILYICKVEIILFDIVFDIFVVWACERNEKKVIMQMASGSGVKGRRKTDLYLSVSYYYLQPQDSTIILGNFFTIPVELFSKYNNCSDEQVLAVQHGTNSRFRFLWPGLFSTFCKNQEIYKLLPISCEKRFAS